MILIFGGTTEGRIAIDVCEQSGKKFYYSTKSSSQEVILINGVRISGAMTSEDIKSFCQTHDVRCIINAAHPFAEGLHNQIMKAEKPVIRLLRHFPGHIGGVEYLKDWDEAISRIKSKRLLALTGVNTIAKMRNYWMAHETCFRIINRTDSINIARQCGFPTEKLLFYPDTIPSVEEEIELMQELGCDAIITKESGTSGGFNNKLEAALRLGLKIYVVERPSTPKEWITVDGAHTLRRAIQTVVPDFFELHTGLTTGACATAATKAAVLSFLDAECPESVTFALPDGELLDIPVICNQRGEATVIKESNDDFDVTKGCKITATISPRTDNKIIFLQGEGVGKVTLPGIGIEVGEPAINPTPRRMVTEEIRMLTDKGFNITISVENGAELWKKTFNHKVGVVDGISIIGTSGIVSPLSNDAFIKSIAREMQVAKAIGCTSIGLASGKKGEDALKESEPGLRVIHYGNFIGKALETAHSMGFERVVIGIMIGKAVKLADGHLDTHSHKVAIDLSRWGVKMARDLWKVMPDDFFDNIHNKCVEVCRKVFPDGVLELKLIKDESV